MTVRMDDEQCISNEFSDQDELMLSNALIIHNTEGSQYPVCPIPYGNRAVALVGVATGLHGGDAGAPVGDVGG